MLSLGEFCCALFVEDFAGGVLTHSHLRNRGDGVTASLIGVAVIAGYMEIVQLLISAGADVNAVLT